MNNHRRIGSKAGKAAAIAFFAFICWIIYLANTGAKSVFLDFGRSLPFGDKLGHFALYGVLALLTNVAFGFRFFSNRWLQWGSLLVFSFAMIEELTQHFLPNRTLDVVDAAADIVGTTLATAVSLALRRDSK